MLLDASQRAAIKSLGGYKSFWGKEKRNIPPTKKKKVKNKKPTLRNALFFDKNKPLRWYIHKRGENVVPSPSEDRIRTILNTFTFDFYYEVSFRGLISQKHQPLRFDFYIPCYKIAIEYDGKGFHSEPERKLNDKLKNIFCKVYGIQLIRLNAKHWGELENYLSIELIKRGVRAIPQSVHQI